MLRSLLLSAMVLMPALAHADSFKRVIVAVDSYERNFNDFSVMATLKGEGVAAAITFRATTSSVSNSYYSINGDSCERGLAMMMNRPGRFSLEVRESDSDGNVACRLVRQ
jgi:hypothetical protein